MGEGSDRSSVREPTLPVQHEIEVTLSCPEDYTNIGDEKATCNDGILQHDGDTPTCYGEKML